MPIVVPPRCQELEDEFQEILITLPPIPPPVQEHDIGSWQEASGDMKYQVNRLRNDQMRKDSFKLSPRVMEETIFKKILGYARASTTWDVDWEFTKVVKNDEFGRALKDYAKRVTAAHFAVDRCRKMGPVKGQLVVESMTRQTPLLPEQAKLVGQFLGVKDPKRVYTDATTGTGTGVSLPRGGGRRTKKSKRHARKTRRRV